MKRFMFLFVIFSIATMSFAQMNKFSNGVYLSLEQLKNQTPAYQKDLEIVIRTEGDIALIGGNDYRIESPNYSLTKPYIKKKIYAFVKNDSLMINCFQHKIQGWYALALTSGNFLAFSGAMTNRDASAVAVFAGGIGGAIAANKRYLYVFSLRTGNVRLLTKECLVEVLQEQPALLDEFKKEPEQDTEEILIFYINKLNKVTLPVPSNQAK